MCSPREWDGHSALGRKLCEQEQPFVTGERMGRHGGGLRDTSTATTEQAVTLQCVALKEQPSHLQARHRHGKKGWALSLVCQ